MGRKAPGKGQRRRRYRAAGWVGSGLLTGLLLSIALWMLLMDSEQSREHRAITALAASDVPHPEALEAGQNELRDRGPRAAVIIDDLGNSRRQARAVSSLPYPLAVAVLPDSPYAARIARQAHQSGKEVLAHMPMEPGDEAVPLNGSFLRTGMGRKDLLATLRANLAEIPYVGGINNHMGSRLTARSRPMGWLMTALRERGLYFVDSRTTAATQGLKEARAAGLPAAERDIFLDHDPAEEAVREQFRKMLAQAREEGTAIAIGHPHPATLKVLRDMLPKASRRGVEIVPLREVVALRSSQASQAGSLAFNVSDN